MGNDNTAIVAAIEQLGKRVDDAKKESKDGMSGLARCIATLEKNVREDVNNIHTKIEYLGETGGVAVKGLSDAIGVQETRLTTLEGRPKRTIAAVVMAVSILGIITGIIISVQKYRINKLRLNSTPFGVENEQKK